MIVYMITNKINNKRYIGQTIGTETDRFKKHINVAFGTENDNNKKYLIHTAIFKYGKENFKIKILAKCNSMEEMNHREEYYIRLLRTLSPIGYNLRPGGNNSRPSEQSKKKMSDSHKGKKQSKESNIKRSKASKGITNIKNIVCVTTGEKFNSLTEASEKYGLSIGKISSVCKLNRKHTGGYVFRYRGQENLVFKRKKRQQKEGYVAHNRKPIMLIELNKTFAHINEAVYFCLKQGRATNRIAIRRVAMGIYKTAAGYTWSFL